MTRVILDVGIIFECDDYYYGQFHIESESLTSRFNGVKTLTQKVIWSESNHNLDFIFKVL